MKIGINKTSNGIHPVLNIKVECLENSDDFDIETLSKIIRIVDDYNNIMVENS